MATDKNVTFIQELYDAYAQGNSQFILDRITDGVDWVIFIEAASLYC
jgi:hypothetical protein